MYSRSWYCCSLNPLCSSLILGSSLSLYASNAALNLRSGCLSMAPAAAPLLALSLFSLTSDMASSASSRLLAEKDAMAESMPVAPPDLSADFLGAPFPLLADLAGAVGVEASSSASSRRFSSALRAASAALSAFFSAAVLPRPPAGSSHRAASAASARAAASTAFLSSLAAFLARPDSFFAFPPPGYHQQANVTRSDGIR